jgi:peptidoglycan/xylan/chitin deacetylase (PgdA/CDA1 family)
VSLGDYLRLRVLRRGGRGRAASFTRIKDCHKISSKLIALTFDDGPSEWTEPILDLLRAADARATFFVMGRWLAGREPIVRRIVAENHELGVHTFDHHDLRAISADEVREELGQTKAALERIVDVPLRFWRPPFFSVDERVADLAAEVGFSELVQCSIDPNDWSEDATVDGVLSSILDQVQPGSIVDLHDGISAQPTGETPTRDATVEAVRRLLPELAKRSLKPVTLSELLAAA